MAALTLVSSSKCFEGYQKIFRHKSKVLQCEMNFSLFIPLHQEGEKFPLLFWLSGLTCTEKNFIEKSGFQKYASKHKIIVVGPDTSPRGCNIEGEDDSYDFGTGAGFYINATEEKWKKNYRMYSYITEELPAIINDEFPTNGKMSIFGHSMGGHGALICGLKNPGKHCSVSAFAPVSNPVEAPWGKKVFLGYLGKNTKDWEAYDATCLAKTYDGPALNILIDQGTEDEFFQKGYLLPDNFISAAKGNDKLLVTPRMQEGYDHSYYFVSTFMGNHIDFHAQCFGLPFTQSVCTQVHIKPVMTDSCTS